MPIKVTLRGFKELDRKLRSLGPKIAQRGLRKATFEAVKIFRDAAKEYAVAGPPHPTKRLGFLVANIVAPRRKTADINQARYSVVVRRTHLTKVRTRRTATSRGPKGGFKAVAGPAIYGRFLEFGTATHRAYPFLTPAFFNNIDKAIQAVAESMKKTIDAESKKSG